MFYDHLSEHSLLAKLGPPMLRKLLWDTCEKWRVHRCGNKERREGLSVTLKFPELKYLRNKYCILEWLWPDIPSRDLQIITENRRFEVIIWGSRDGISGHNHPKMQYLFRFYHGLCILWGNKVRIPPNSLDKQIRSIGRRRRKLNSIYSLGRILDDIPRQTENETWNFHSWLYY